MQHTLRNNCLSTLTLLLALALLCQPALATVADDAPQSGAAKHYVVKPNQLQVGKTKSVYVSSEPASDLSEIDAVQVSPDGRSLQLTTPAHTTAGSVAVTVTNPAPNSQSKPLPGGFTYVLPQ